MAARTPSIHVFLGRPLTVIILGETQGEDTLQDVVAQRKCSTEFTTCAVHHVFLTMSKNRAVRRMGH